MAVAGFLLAGSTPSIMSVTILGLITGAAIGVALGIMFTHRAKRKHTQQVTKICFVLGSFMPKKPVQNERDPYPVVDSPDKAG
jgi:NhaP-type Na+/H+ or K+/H+ antiporter